MRSEFDEPKVLGRLVAAYWVTHAVNMEQHETRHKKQVAATETSQRGSSRSKTAKPRDVRTDCTADRSGTAVRGGSLYSAYSRNQTAALIPVPGIQTRERRQQLKQKQVTIMVTKAMHTWAAGMKEQLIKIEINMSAILAKQV